MTETSAQTVPVLFNELPLRQGGIALQVVLNAPRTLNALSLAMIQRIQPRLDAARNDPQVKVVLLQGSGEKAFCAGGDVVELCHAIRRGDQQLPETYFSAEYRLDYTLHTFPKPVICWGSGIVMGGGMGLMNGSSHRVVTERSMLAMPEVTIGLYPDVGGSWFLNHMPGQVGLFLALTGSRLNAADALLLGLADHYMDSAHLDNLIHHLQQADWDQHSNHAVVSQVLAHVARMPYPDLPLTSNVLQHFGLIQQLMHDLDPCVLREKLEDLASDDAWLQRALQTIQHGSPLAMRLIQQQLARCRHLSLKSVFQAELALSVQICRQGDFAEGVRALLVDKDNKPQWRFGSLTEVPVAFVEAFFASPWEVNPLADL
ncbi:enoyl-CoA hydratase/isomerase family protein [Pontibacter sp. JAM-7]|uniref:enoyl-CoA hydratase/isomerase family protein n=1 Tax=Pontibacter sp. JAM-7 TaxID=3366581 RepID=UPI003AF6F64E